MEEHFNKTVKICSKTNSGTSFKPVWSWSVLETTTGLLDKLSEKKIIRNEGNKIIADHILIIMPTTIDTANRIIIGTDAYDIYSITNPNMLNHHYEIKMELLASSFYDDMGC